MFRHLFLNPPNPVHLGLFPFFLKLNHYSQVAVIDAAHHS